MRMDFGRVMGLLAMRFGESKAIVNVERGRSFTFNEYHLVTNRVANMMRGFLGLGTGDVAFALAENDNLLLLHLPTAFKQEATIVFTNFRESQSEHLRQIDFVEAKVVFIESSLIKDYYDDLRSRGCTIVAMDAPEDDLRLPGVHDFWELVNRASDENPGVELDVHEHVPVFRFTGGTTGNGKCAMYTIDIFGGTRDATNTWPDFALGPTTKFLNSTPISHGSILLFWPTFFAGGTTYTTNTADLDLWCDVVEKEGITHGFLVPTLLYRLVDTPAHRARNLSSLKLVVYGAAPIAPTRLSQLIDHFGPIFLQSYGSTEAMQFVTALSLDDHVIKDDKGRERLGSAGRVTAGVELYISDESGKEVPIGEIGEIRVRSRSTITGYFRNLEANTRDFVDGFWLSGDVGYLDEDGYLFIVDRKKDMIISGGFNIYAIEVEAAIAEHPAVSSSAVVGIPHDEWGEVVHAEVVLAPGLHATSEDLIAFAKARLGYKAPKSVVIVDALPLSPVGKVLRRDVKAKYWSSRRRAVN